jgi:type VI secretion system secreted protein VgrG
MKQGSEYYFYQNDHLGTPQKLTAVNGAVVWSAKYSSFGQAEVNPTSTVTNNLRFPGQYFDQETGLHYNFHRFYDSKSGRYSTPDPIGLNGGINLFAYVLNDPVNLVDPLGLLNPVKLGVGFINAFRGVKSMAMGVTAIVTGTAAIPFTAGVSGAAGYAIGAAQLVSGFANLNRGLGQMSEAHDESLSDSSFKNLLGLAPFGQKFDDPCEPGPGEYFKDIWDRFAADPYSAVKKAVTDFFAFD